MRHAFSNNHNNLRKVQLIEALGRPPKNTLYVVSGKANLTSKMKRFGTSYLKQREEKFACCSHTRREGIKPDLFELLDKTDTKRVQEISRSYQESLKSAVLTLKKGRMDFYDAIIRELNKGHVKAKILKRYICEKSQSVMVNRFECDASCSQSMHVLYEKFTANIVETEKVLIKPIDDKEMDPIMCTIRRFEEEDPTE